jgi:DNA-binding transcriptional regulator YdaS (Cro superfamily)
MHPSALFEELKKQHDLSSGSDIARLIGLTPARISQMQTRQKNLSARQIASYIAKAAERGNREALLDPIRPIVEMYPLGAVESKQGAKWELLATSKADKRNQLLKQHLVAAKGVYLFYDSLGRAIYAGKTESQNIWKEMTSAFNRERSNHQAFLVSHPSTGESFSPAHEKQRQPRKRVVYLYDTAVYFSAYEVSPLLIPKLEALLVRAFCNTLSNKKMEKF